MSSAKRSEDKTRMFARVLGPYLFIVATAAAVRASGLRALLGEFGADSLWPWVTGAFVLLCGLVVIALHPYWRGTAAITVSLLGSLTALKGLFLLAFPKSYVSAASSAIDAVTWWRAGFVVLALVGLYLTFIGWVPATSRPKPEAAKSTLNLPRAA